MTQKTNIKHPVENHILNQLESGASYRFIDLRPTGVESNLFSYHLSKLVRLGLVFKSDDGFYSLGSSSDAAQESSDNLRGVMGGSTPIQLMLVVQDGFGNTLLRAKGGGFELPKGNVLATDRSLQHSAARIFKEITGMTAKRFKHVGDGYVSTQTGRYFVHVVRLSVSSTPTLRGCKWASVRSPEVEGLPAGDLAILSRTFFNDPFFFEEF